MASEKTKSDINYDLENRRLFEQLKLDPDNNAIIDKIVLLNSHLVGSQVKKYFPYFNCDFEDLVQEGMIGLLLAIREFRLERKCKFSTYAIYWIRQSIFRACPNQQHNRTIKLPSFVNDDLIALNRAERLLNSQGITPTSELLAEEMYQYSIRHKRSRMSDDDFRKDRRNHYSLKRIRNLIQIRDTVQGFSLDYIINNDDGAGTPLMDLISSQNKSVEEEVLGNSEYDKISEVLPRLEPMDQIILNLRFAGGKTLDEVGEVLNISRERVRQREKRARIKVRAWIVQNELKFDFKTS